MKYGRGIRTVSTQMRWILRSQARASSTIPRTESHNRSMVLDVKRMPIISSEIFCCSLR